MAKIVKDWTKLIVPRVNQNYMPNTELGDESFCTTDIISIKSKKELSSQNTFQRQKSLTDFAIMNNSQQSYFEAENRKYAGPYFLRNTYPYNDVCEQSPNGSYSGKTCFWFFCGLSPALSLQLPQNVSARNISKEIGDVKEVKNQSGKTLYHTIEFGEYPKTRVPNNMQSKLEELYNNGHLNKKLKCTGRLFTTNGQVYFNDGHSLKQSPEFEYKGERYVRVTAFLFDSHQIYSDGTYSEKHNIEWVKVEPITFKIENYNQFKNGTEKTLKLETEELVLGGLPYYPKIHDENCSMWQNSLVRAFLNSARSEELDGNPDFEAPLKWDFRNTGFLHQAFDMTRQPTVEYTISQAETYVCDYAFRGCVGLKKIIIPPHVTEIGNRAFEDCVNAQVHIKFGKTLDLNKDALVGTKFKFVYFSKDGESMVLSPYEDATLGNHYIVREFNESEILKYCNNNYRKNFVALSVLKQQGKIKFIPPEYTIETFPSSQIDKYFVNNNNQRWGRLVKTLGFDTLQGDQKNNSLVDLMKIYYAIGGFSQNQGESEKAFDYVLKYVATTRTPNETPSQIGEEIHRRFAKLKLKDAYNPTFAQFFMKYYHDKPDFMNFRLLDKEGDLMENQDYLCMAHNSFERILKNYPNMVVNGNEQRSLLTPRFVARHSTTVEYDYVDQGNETLAEIVGRYGYDQEQFEHIQQVYNKAKTIKDKYVISADKAMGKNGITFRVLSKDDPLGFVLGDITNCCQIIGSAGESCVDDGYTNTNAGFLVFEETLLDDNGMPTEETRVLGQAYVWYDPQTKTVCYDNIEIPTKVLNQLRRGRRHGERLSTKSLMDAVEESAKAIMQSMNKNGITVKRVTTGAGYNDLQKELNDRFGEPETNPKAKHRDYAGYSDATKEQYVILTYDQVTKQYAKTICETANQISADLQDIQTSQNQNDYAM